MEAELPPQEHAQIFEDLPLVERGFFAVVMVEVHADAHLKDGQWDIGAHLCMCACVCMCGCVCMCACVCVSIFYSYLDTHASIYDLQRHRHVASIQEGVDFFHFVAEDQLVRSHAHHQLRHRTDA